MKFNPFILLVVLAVGIISCESNKTVKTKSGLTVNYVTQGDSSGYNQNDIILVNMTYAKPDGKILFNTAEAGSAVPLRYDTAQWSKGGQFYEVLALCGAGDSVTFEISANELFMNTFKTPVPDSIMGTDMIKFELGIEAVMDMPAFEIFRNEMMAKRNAKSLVKEAEVIATYMEENELVGESTESGLTYVMLEEGEGPSPEVGAVVAVHYTGTLLDGTQFDSSEGREPIEFPLGQGRVIPGWDEGIALLNKGAKATFLIPSSLAYGERGAPGAIPPNSILKFDVELVEIKN